MPRLRLQLYAAILASLTIVFALFMPKIYLGPFTATLGLHVPLFLSFTLGPWYSFLVGLFSALGFLLAGLPIVIAARAAMHGFIGLLGGWLVVNRKWSFRSALGTTSLLHAGSEALIVLPFGFDFQTGLVLVGGGTLLHHIVDSFLALLIIKVISKQTKMG